MALGSPATSASRRALSKMSCKILPRRFKICQEIRLFQIHANFWNLQESFLSYKILVPNLCENLVLLDLLPDSYNIFKDLAIDLENILPRFFSRSWQDFFIGGSKIGCSSLLIHTIAIPKERLYWHEIRKLIMFMIPNILSGLGFGGHGIHSSFILQVQEDFS